MIEWRVDGVAVDSCMIWYQELGFGQVIPDHQASEYSINVSTDEFFRLMAQPYAEWIEDQRRDDELTGEPTPKYFKELNYPDFQELARHPSLFTETIQAFLWDDLLRKFLASSDKQQPLWVVNSIDTVEVRQDQVLICGRIYKSRVLT